MRLPRRPRLLIPVLIAVVVITVLFFRFAGIYTDYLWFEAVQYSSVFSTMLLTQVLLFLVGAVLTVAIVGGNMMIAHRTRPMFGLGLFGGPQGADRYRMAIDPHRKAVFLVLMGMLGLFAGLTTASQWKTWLQFANRTSFGQTDPQFNMDVSFFMFTYPFIRMVLNFLFTAVVLSIILAAVVHYLYGGFRFQSPGGLQATRAARSHLAILIGVFVLLKAIAYWIDRYGLVFSTRGFVHGASYTDVNAMLPAKTILAIIALICAALFFAAVIRPGGMLPGVGFGLMVLSALLIGWVYPALVEQFQVRPNQQAKEETYIARNIEATRNAYGVDEAEIINYDTNAATAQDASRDTTISGVRLLDPNLVAKTYQQKQRIRGFYDFQTTLDVDRYPDANGNLQDTVIAVRELTGPPPEQNNWINRHLVYTHGYGIVAAPGSDVDDEGLPAFNAKDMPVTGPLVERTGLKESRVYFGEADAVQYVIVGGGRNQELDYPTTQDGGSGQANTSYTGKGGVPVGSFFNRLLYAAKYGEMNLLLSGDISEQSKILYVRNPRDRVASVAPFLSLDSDPYPAIVDGRIVWIVDGYTTSNEYPYSQSESLEEMTRDTSTDARVLQQVPRDRINYIRNSVKATVDAYDGTVTLYAWDEQDPVLKTWRKAFPGILKSRSEMSQQLQQHLRYPEDLFKVQRYVLSRYHIEDAKAFYGGQDFWNVPDDPSSGERNVKQPPYYLSVRMPGSSGPAFSLTTTFVPRQGPNLAAFMAVNATAGPDYGKLRILRMPANTTIPGPGQVQNTFQNRFSGELNVLGLGQARILYGNLLTLPFAGGLVYIEPVYVQTAAGAGQEPYPILRRVLVMYGNKVGSANTLEEALNQVFGDQANQQQQPQPPADQPQTPPAGGGDPALADAVRKAQQAYDAAQKALSANPPDWAAYGKAQQDLANAMKELENAVKAQPAPGPTGTAAPSPAPTPTASPTDSPPAATPSPSTP